MVWRRNFYHIWQYQWKAYIVFPLNSVLNVIYFLFSNKVSISQIFFNEEIKADKVHFVSTRNACLIDPNGVVEPICFKQYFLHENEKHMAHRLEVGGGSNGWGIREYLHYPLSVQFLSFSCSFLELAQILDPPLICNRFHIQGTISLEIIKIT